MHSPSTPADARITIEHRCPPSQARAHDPFSLVGPTPRDSCRLPLSPDERTYMSPPWGRLSGHVLVWPMALRQTLEAGVRWGYLTSNPARRAGRNRQPPPRMVRTYDRAELEAIARELSPAYRPLPVFAAATGLRPEELFALERRDVDRRARVLTVRQTISDGELVDLGKTDGARRQAARRRDGGDRRSPVASTRSTTTASVPRTTVRRRVCRLCAARQSLQPAAPKHESPASAGLPRGRERRDSNPRPPA